jgi:hypothetical protein
VQLAELTPPDYPASLENTQDLGHRHFVRPNGEGGYLWWHDCPAVAHISWGWFGPGFDGQASGHRITSHAPLHVVGSLLCTDCQDHGFIENGRWKPA